VHQKTKLKKKQTKDKTKRQIKNDTLTTFQTLLEQEKWKIVYQKQDANCMYNSFLSIFLIIFKPVFHLYTYKNINMKQKDWLTQRIKISSIHRDKEQQ